jgi:hypothetical protein
MPLVPFDFFAPINAALLAGQWRLHALGGDDPVTGARRAIVFLSMALIYLIQRWLPDAAFVPLAEVIRDRLPGRKVVR